MRTSRLIPMMLTFAFLPHWSADSQARLIGGVGSAGGTKVMNGAYILNGSISQTVVGTTASASYKHDAGFWKPLYGFIFAGVPNEEDGIPLVSALLQNFPNPFNPSTTIRYGLSQKSHVTLTVYNALGQQVAQLVDGEMETGYHEVRFDGSGLSSGVYFYRMQAGSYVETKKLLLVR